MHTRDESHIPPLADIRNRVVEDRIEEESRKALRDYVDRRRGEVEIRVVEDTGAMSQAPPAG